jgi:hypothetical protein
MLVVVSIPITGNTTKKHDITGWFAWGWKVNILPKIFCLLGSFLSNSKTL